MGFALHGPQNPATDHPAQRQSSDPWHTAGEPDDLGRLQSCLDWLNRERVLLALETADRQEPRQLPRAPQLDPVPGISPPTKSLEPRRERLPFVLAPPLACDRLQPPPAERPGFSSTMLAALLAAAVAGSLAYHVSEGFFSVPSVAEAAALETPLP